MSLDLKSIHDSINNKYKIDLFLMYSKNNEIIKTDKTSIMLYNNYLSNNTLESILKKNIIDINFVIKYILKFNINESIDSTIKNLKNNNNYINNHSISVIKNIENIEFTNKHFLNTLIIIYKDKEEIKIIKNNQTKKNKLKKQTKNKL
tara:strand:+ start:5249 stop:5692 length:444 start_codon:yes stop_codon:yes gene_type:complete